MREYETLYVSQAGQSEGDVAQLNERLTSIITKHNGRLFFARNMGKRVTAYRVGKESKAIYTCLDYAAAGPAVTEIERLLRLDESVLRFLTVVKRDDVDIEARAAEVTARGEDHQSSGEEEETMDVPLDRELDEREGA